MMMFFSNNKIVPIVEKNVIRISYNDEKCFYCNSNDMIINGVKNNLSYCKRCDKYLLLFECISKDKYKNIIGDRLLDDIKKTNFEGFIKSSNI
jgi:hypothetical protein